MSGRRAKALRREFEAKHGRAPLKSEVIGYVRGTVAFRLSEWRRVKRAYLRARRAA